ncbi:ATP-grasp domain-containing protein [Streptomyces sp. MMBL 11-3]|uniref:ATP-grasp domain-containing protein n=1 Tax=Streptomyces sp. MMBL 11-3 TaxID=3382639 RepID=UPI0039B631F7
MGLGTEEASKLAVSAKQHRDRFGTGEPALHDIGYFLKCAAKDLGWEYQALRGGWLHELQKEGTKHFVIGYSFPHNSNTAARVAMDKVATYTVLSAAGIDTVQHLLVLAKGRSRREIQRLCHDRLELAGLPASYVVLKPVTGSNGLDVERAGTFRAAQKKLDLLLGRYDGVAAVSPYLNLRREVRVIVLDGRPLLAFEKIRSADWRHNLAFGAAPNLLSVHENEHVIAAALDACEVIGIRLAAVDLVEARDRSWRILEVNEGINLASRFAAQGAEYMRAAQISYHAIVRALE